MNSSRRLQNQSALKHNEDIAIQGTAKKLSRKTPDPDNAKESILSDTHDESDDKATNVTLSPLKDFKAVQQKQHKMNANTTHYGNMHFKKRRCSQQTDLLSTGKPQQCLLSPLLGRFTAEEFHNQLVQRICPSCEFETMNKPTQQLLKYNWQKRPYHETELFQENKSNNFFECPRHQTFRNRRQSENTKIVRENLIEKRNVEPKDENVLREISGRMSAFGKLGKHKYAGHETQDWTSRTMHINEDIELPRRKLMKEHSKQVYLLEQRAINKLNGKMRHVLHKGYYKHNPWEFKMPRDLVAEREQAKEIDRKYRLKNFAREMDTINIDP